MLKKERQRKILEIVGRSGKVEVEELANALVVSVMTIRRDLTELACSTWTLSSCSSPR